MLVGTIVLTIDKLKHIKSYNNNYFTVSFLSFGLPSHFGHILNIRITNTNY